MANSESALSTAPNILQQRFEARFSKLADWEQAFLIAGLERTAAMLDAEEIDAAPVLDVGSLTSSKTPCATSETADGKNENKHPA